MHSRTANQWEFKSQDFTGGALLAGSNMSKGREKSTGSESELLTVLARFRLYIGLSLFVSGPKVGIATMPLPIESRPCRDA